MKKRKLLIFLLVLPMLFSSIFVSADSAKQTQGKIYYISASTGNDKNAGTSEATAWKSLEKVSKLKLKPGDAVLLKCGDKWIGEQLKINSPIGTKENMITIGTYGEGEKPKLQMFKKEVPKYSDVPIIKLENAENVLIDGLDIGFAGIGIDLYYNLVTNSENVKIHNCHFHDFYGFNQADPGSIKKYPHAASIVVTANIPIPGNTEPVLKGLYIDKCTTYDAGALYTYASRIGSSGYTVEGLYVTNCVMENNGVYGISLCNMKGGYMDNCKVINNGSRMAGMGSMGVMISGEDFTIMNSEIAFQQRLGNNPDGGGIDFEHLGYDVDIINCYIHDNSGVGIMMYSSHGDESHQNKRVRIIGNVFENNNQNVYNPGGTEILSLPIYSLVDGAIYNNRYMESKNLFTMSMDSSVDIRGNISYPESQQGKMWPIYDFDDVRAYVLEGTPLPDLEQEMGQDALYGKISKYGNYFIGAGVALIVLAIVTLLIVILKKKKTSAVAMVLLFAVLFSTLGTRTTAFAATNNGPTKSNGKAKDGVYRLSQMFSDEMREWQYYWTTGTNAQKMEYSAAEKSWKGQSPAITSIINKSGTWHPYVSGYTLATFTCPASGRVRVGTEQALELANVVNSPDGTIFIISSDGELIGEPVQLSKANPKQEYKAVELDVYEGQVIGFYLHMNINNAGDATIVLPFVEYKEYKDVQPPQAGAQNGNESTEAFSEKTLRTDIKPIEVEEEVQFEIIPMQLIIGAAPVLLIGASALILILAKKRCRKKGENKDA